MSERELALENNFILVIWIFWKNFKRQKRCEKKTGIIGCDMDKEN